MDNTQIITRPVLPKTVTPGLLRQFMDGQISRELLDRLPRFFVGQLEHIARRMQRQAIRAHKRDTKRGPIGSQLLPAAVRAKKRGVWLR